jgi:hypothetical protein
MKHGSEQENLPMVAVLLPPAPFETLKSMQNSSYHAADR